MLPKRWWDGRMNEWMRESLLFSSGWDTHKLVILLRYKRKCQHTRKINDNDRNFNFWFGFQVGIFCDRMISTSHKMPPHQHNKHTASRSPVQKCLIRAHVQSFCAYDALGCITRPDAYSFCAVNWNMYIALKTTTLMMMMMRRDM